MKINGISIQGMFSYSENVTYERNDFVIKGTTIYVCSPVLSDSVTGEDPETSKNYYIYLGDRAASLSDYDTFLDKGQGTNKYISLDILPSILNHYMIGLTGKGVIGDWIKYREDGELETSGTSLGSYSDPNSILSDIMNDDNINYAIYRVSGKLPELKILVGGEADYYILKQYTYYTDNNVRVRVQELIDHSEGQIYYRSSSSTSTTNWKSATTNSRILQSRANNLYSLYASKLASLEVVKSSLLENFRFCTLKNFTGPNATIRSYTGTTDEGKDPNNRYIFIGGNIKELECVNVRVLDYRDESRLRSYEFSFDPIDFVGNNSDNGDETQYYINEEFFAIVNFRLLSDGTASSNGSIDISIVGPKTSEGEIKYKISEIYYKKYFNL